MTYATISSIIAGATPEVLPVEAEADLIVRAQAGDEEAMTALIAQYGPAFRNALRGLQDEALEDAEQEAAVAFLEVIKTHDTSKSPRLAGRVADALRRGVSASVNNVHVGVPLRQVERFFAILKAAGGSVQEGYAIASAHDMDPLTFLAIARAVSMDSVEGMAERADAEGSQSAEAAPSVTAAYVDPFTAAEDALLVQSLFTLLDERETRITRFAYGFDALPLAEDEDPKEGLAKTREEGYAVANDGVIARHLGMTRPTVSRVRRDALATMREALSGE